MTCCVLQNTTEMLWALPWPAPSDTHRMQSQTAPQLHRRDIAAPPWGNVLSWSRRSHAAAGPAACHAAARLPPRWGCPAPARDLQHMSRLLLMPTCRQAGLQTSGRSVSGGVLMYAPCLCSSCEQQRRLREASVAEHERRAVQGTNHQLGRQVVRLQRQARRVDAAPCAACKAVAPQSTPCCQALACKLPRCRVPVPTACASRCPSVSHPTCPR
jgi:hypothetical protein